LSWEGEGIGTTERSSLVKKPGRYSRDRQRSVKEALLTPHRSVTGAPPNQVARVEQGANHRIAYWLLVGFPLVHSIYVLMLDMDVPGTKKEYVLVSSDNRSSDSVSTTDFHLRLNVPINNVVKTDLIQVSMDYNVANIKAPDNEFTIGNGQVPAVTNTITLEEGLYTVDVLAAWIQQQLTTELGQGYTVYYDVKSKIMIEYVLPNSNVDYLNKRAITCTSPVLAQVLGLSLTQVSATLLPIKIITDGANGTYRWSFPYPVKLSGLYPYLFIQSSALGVDIRVANGNIGYWRMLLNDQVNYSLTMTNNRVDNYVDVSKVLHDIDIKLVYPDGSVVNNNGGRFTLLLEIVRLV